MVSPCWHMILFLSLLSKTEQTLGIILLTRVRGILRDCTFIG